MICRKIVVVEEVGVRVGYEIALARGDDVGALVRISSALFAEDAGTRDPTTDVGWPGEHGWDHFSDLVIREDAICLLARSGPAAVGYLAGVVAPATTVRPVAVAELQSMYVAPDHRSNGLGKQLVSRFRSWAREFGAGRLSVTAYAANERAIRFHRSAGFGARSVTLESAL